MVSQVAANEEEWKVGFHRQQPIKSSWSVISHAAGNKGAVSEVGSNEEHL